MGRRPSEQLLVCLEHEIAVKMKTFSFLSLAQILSAFVSFKRPLPANLAEMFKVAVEACLPFCSKKEQASLTLALQQALAMKKVAEK